MSGIVDMARSALQQAQDRLKSADLNTRYSGILIAQSVLQRLSAHPSTETRALLATAGKFAMGEPYLLPASTATPESRAEKQWPDSFRPGQAILTACMDRNDHLVETLPVWLAMEEVSEIVVVDWSSFIPVKISLSEAGISDPRIRIVRVEGEPRWWLSAAYNCGFRFVSCEKVVKADADVFPAPDFFGQNALEAGAFLAGNWRLTEEGQAHINGNVLLWTRDAARTGGYDERITRYGWDDDEFYSRLEEAGLKRMDIEPSSLRHIEHSDERRMAGSNHQIMTGWEELEASTQYSIVINREMSQRRQPWSADKSDEKWLILEYSESEARVFRESRVRHEENEPEANAARLAAAREHFLVDHQMASELVRDCELDVTLTLHPLQASMQLLAAKQSGRVLRPPIPPIVKRDRKLVVEPKHGLGNRMRAIASAASLAEKSGRSLEIAWVPDEHCNCELADLFVYDGVVHNSSYMAEAAENGAQITDYLALDGDGAEDHEVDLSVDADIYVRSQRVLQSSYTDYYHSKAQLARFVPAPEVEALIQSVRSPNDVGIHIRMFVADRISAPTYELPFQWGDDSHDMITYWRRRSHYSAFVRRLTDLFEHGEAFSAFLASDTDEAYEHMHALFGDRIAILDRKINDRSAEQVRYALADAILVGRSRRILGSYWSSFTELASFMSPMPHRLELSGCDF